ncbi:Sec-independent protein translocase protein TatA [Corynebacterium occultum]|uniref:Sec-independent protein translocase protein TatA n=1 Tax=Corynebacterium occultum TaxID=2675219 RepID=A0A6B8W1J7_9CORY|nr:Sec-independent protein translocase subunit TatA [Corynebacterium occultum]QGU07394.1 Sec-independent protein translocase protein TatA [Corynebacterium occultum]
MPTPGIWEILIIAVVVILLFGAKKLPDAARSIGRSMRIFKSEVKEMNNDTEQPQQQVQLPQAQPEQDFWDRPENQPNAQPNFQQPPVQQPQQPNQQNPNPQN